MAERGQRAAARVAEHLAVQARDERLLGDLVALLERLFGELVILWRAAAVAGKVERDHAEHAGVAAQVVARQIQRLVDRPFPLLGAGPVLQQERALVALLQGVALVEAHPVAAGEQ